MSLRRHRTWPSLGVETSPTSKFFVDRSLFPFCISLKKPSAELCSLMHFNPFVHFVPLCLLLSPGSMGKLLDTPIKAKTNYTICQ